MQGRMSWQSVRDEALHRIHSQIWPAGTRIPDEAALAAELGCARATVNRALRDLADAGLLERRRRGGTRVALTPVRKAVFTIPIIRQDIEARGHTAGYTLLDDRLLSMSDISDAAVPENGPETLRRIRALHSADDTAFCLEDRWLNPKIAPPDTGFETLSANEWLVRTVNYAAGELSVGAISAGLSIARHLNCEPGTALLVLERTTRGPAGGTTGFITAVRLIYAPGYRIQTAL